jgi:hypothetical protein
MIAAPTARDPAPAAVAAAPLAPVVGLAVGTGETTVPFALVSPEPPPPVLEPPDGEALPAPPAPPDGEALPAPPVGEALPAPPAPPAEVLPLPLLPPAPPVGTEMRVVDPLLEPEPPATPPFPPLPAPPVGVKPPPPVAMLLVGATTELETEVSVFLPPPDGGRAPEPVEEQDRSKRGVVPRVEPTTPKLGLGVFG